MTMSVGAQASRDVSVQTEDGATVTYTLRGLSEAEIKPWAAFCASVFSYKANPPPATYFERHYLNDPEKEPCHVRVAFRGDQMVASCRVFRRRISKGSGEYVEAGGIGEVCTDQAHRKRGLSAQLLQDAVQIISEAGMEVSFLHAAPAFFPVYEKAGYVCTTSQWSVASIDRSALAQVASSDQKALSTVRLAQFPEDTETLQALHQQLSEHRFSGCIGRSTVYWNQYISKELEGALYVVEIGGKIVAWLSVQSRGPNELRIRDYGCIDNGIQGYAIMKVLLAEATKGLETAAQFQLIVPTFVVNEVRASFASRKQQSESESFIYWSAVTVDDDQGWMYKQIGDSGLSMPELTLKHLIWPADSF